MFERLHVDKKYPGTGIGLAIVRRAMDRMGGKAGMESDGSNGSKFWLELPEAEIPLV
jgi:signal transduction histidine kinase